MMNTFVITPITILWKKLWSALLLNVCHLGNCPIALLSREFPILSWCSSTSIHNSTSQCSDLDFELGECHQEAELSKNLFGGRARAAVAVESSFQGQPWCTGLVGGRVCLPFCFCTMILAVVLFAI